MQHSLKRWRAGLAVLCLLLLPCVAQAQETYYKLTGYVTDATTGEALIGVAIRLPKGGGGTTTNNYGYYTLTLKGGAPTKVQFNYIGYTTREVELTLEADQLYNVQLEPIAELLDEVTVTASYTTEVETMETGRVKIRGEDIRRAPSLMGEQDLVKYLQLLPGVARGSEGFSGPIVRGGNVDENLYLLDGNPLYNVHHLLGLFSTFNADALKSASFYKGSFPARFGGRLSSVLDVRTKDGDMQEYHGTLSVGLISSKLHLEGPIWKGKTSFSLALRRTYLDLLMRPFINRANKERNDEQYRQPGDHGESIPSYYFYDINAKINHRFSDRDRLYLAFYLGQDRFSIQDNESRWVEEPRFTPPSPGAQPGEVLAPKPPAEQKVRVNNNIFGGIYWGNLLASIGWNHIFTPQLFSNTTFYYSHYNSDIITRFQNSREVEGKVVPEPSLDLQINSGIEDFGVRSDFEWRPSNQHFLRFGLDAILHRFRPTMERVELKHIPEEYSEMKGLLKGKKGEVISSQEYALYAEDEWQIMPKLSMNLGVRGALLRVEGQTYLSLEPRTSLRYSLLPSLSLKGSYAEMSQAVHLLQSTAISLPTDLWVPVTARIKPMRARQAVLGLYWEQGGYEASVEGYYKWLQNQIAYRDGAPMHLSESNWQDRVAAGKGRAYGAELLLRKGRGKLTGWIAYTLSWSDRIYPGGEINNGKRFYDKYDNRHRLNLVAQYAFGKRFDISASWVLSNGNRMTIPTGTKSNMQGERREYVSSRNNFELPLYHRLDLSLNFYRYGQKGQQHIWNISVYNAYMHHNSFLVDTELETQRRGDELIERQKITSVALFPIIPSISYTFKF